MDDNLEYQNRRGLRRLEGFIDKLKNNEIDYQPKGKEEYGVDWSKYDRAQVNELKDMILFIGDVVDRGWLVWDSTSPEIRVEGGPLSARRSCEGHSPAAVIRGLEPSG